MNIIEEIVGGPILTRGIRRIPRNTSCVGSGRIEGTTSYAPHDFNNFKDDCPSERGSDSPSSDVNILEKQRVLNGMV